MSIQICIGDPAVLKTDSFFTSKEQNFSHVSSKMSAINQADPMRIHVGHCREGLFIPS